MSKPRYYYPDKEQQRKGSPWNVLLAIIFVLMVTIGFACLGLNWAITRMSQVEFAQYPPHYFQGIFFGVMGGACIGFIVAILVILAIVLWRRFTD